jgi:hypothetical protein
VLCRRLKTLFTSPNIIEDARAQLLSLEFDLHLQAASWASEVEAIVSEAFPEPTFTADQQKSIVLSNFLEKLPGELYAPIKRLPTLATIELAIMAVEAERSLQAKIRGACLVQKQGLQAASMLADIQRLKANVAFISKETIEVKQGLAAPRAQNARANQNPFARKRNNFPNQGTNDSSTRQRETRSCHSCGKLGHISPNCRSTKRNPQNSTFNQNSNQNSNRNFNQNSNQNGGQNSSGSSNFACFNCGKNNHYARDCRAPRGNARGGQNNFGNQNFQPGGQGSSNARVNAVFPNENGETARNDSGTNISPFYNMFLAVAIVSLLLTPVQSVRVVTKNGTSLPFVFSQNANARNVTSLAEIIAQNTNDSLFYSGTPFKDY